MDDLTLLDLLECPVCFEKLDVTAKVLPCQHTFCKPCLQRIFKAHKELRCPECRTLVFCSIEALPANLLLVRLLDGVRSGQSSGRGGSFRRPGVLTSQDSRKSRTDPRGLQSSPFRLVPNIRIHMDGVPRAKALCNYRGQNPGDLRFNKGDVILLRRQLDENWYQGEINGVSGIFPASSVEVIKQLPQPPPLCRALYNFDLRDKDKSENQDCLTFLKDDIITVISRVDENWAEGKLGDQVGIFPILFVEPNLTARHLLEKNKGRQSARTKTLSLVPSSSRGKANNTPTLRRGPGSRRKGPGQFSITTALNTLNRMVHSPSGRHMVEISTPVLISSSNPSVITQHMEKTDIPPSSVGQVSTYHPVPASPGHSTAIVSLPGSQQHLSANIKTSSFPDSRSPGLYTTWTLSNSSVSSQGSISEGDPRQNRPFKSVFVPTAIVNPVRSTANPGTLGQGSLRKSGRSSMRKSKWWQRDGSLQRPAQSGIPTLVVGSLRHNPTMVVRPQQFQFHQPQGVPSSPSTVVAELGPKPTPTGEPALTCVSRGSDTRIRSAASSLIMEGKEIPIKSEPPPKPPASAPPSILVKPENSRNGIEKQVKTVRFQNYSPPPAKQYTSHPTSGKPEQPATLKGSQPEAAPSGPEMTVLFAHRSGCHSGQQTDLRRKSSLGKTMTPVPAASAIQTVFPSK
ncbi:E3 ubiquitin-protein ligase SH3RF2 isoform X3 [Canis lupus baileyi]|uniref:E3 ubiquitin-protein ligase SH3RF2 isoform X3 n=1 Tax=Canis lupus dingo TaxID=286419 RepID=UPI0015F15C78|nr:E3 ubiquitin-protein ligase SH3RF2 isoform X3 [Canis lupus dingo]XP_038314592.1 E3 ubiquitin-protein ligase SH3RF2 isoform X3 [Canis lupus familiaris]XP_038386440.1 E3 ubiquitin-protein ligase SH3RF2 isoform X3 [Canis lupus familiaris]XP_038514730.1 E3 ubiquitin-protein ligase SH3RF2 isoform X3 [Canis lupus familiaris]